MIPGNIELNKKQKAKQLENFEGMYETRDLHQIQTNSFHHFTLLIENFSVYVNTT
jgi:hypothetical protein